MVKVSVIIPNYNRAPLVAQTIENMLQQTLAPHEVIVVDDGSTDQSVDVIQKFGNHVTLIQQSNQGPGSARNTGLKIATGEFIQFMDSDDLLSKNKLEVQAKALLRDNDIAYGPWVKAYFDTQTIRISDVVLQQKQLPEDRTFVEWFLSGWSVVFQQCLFRHEFLKKVGFYRTDMWTCDDSELFLRILLASPKIVYSSDCLMLYRLDDYGKVTGSGFTSLCRVEDWAKFLLIASEKCSLEDWTKTAIYQQSFFVNVWKTITLLRQLNSQQADLVQHLTMILQYSHLPLQFWGLQSRLNEIRKGGQQRLKGHRWPSCYQPGRISSHQRQLIQTIGLELA